MDEITYFDDLDRRRDYEQIKIALISINEGRNLDCWPLGSFGWKDADLEPSGCTGIKSIITLDEYSVTVLVGGHKTFCPHEEHEPSDIEQEVINDIPFPGDWSGDDWQMYMEPVEVKVEWIMNERLGQPDYLLTAGQIVEESKKALNNFQTTMREASHDWDSL